MYRDENEASRYTRNHKKTVERIATRLRNSILMNFADDITLRAFKKTSSRVVTQNDCLRCILMTWKLTRRCNNEFVRETVNFQRNHCLAIVAISQTNRETRLITSNFFTTKFEFEWRFRVRFAIDLLFLSMQNLTDETRHVYTIKIFRRNEIREIRDEFKNDWRSVAT